MLFADYFLIPPLKGTLKANREGVFIIYSGAIPLGYPDNPNARYLIDDGLPDYDDIPPWHQGDPKVAERNNQLKQRQLKARIKKTSPEK